MSIHRIRLPWEFRVLRGFAFLCVLLRPIFGSFVSIRVIRVGPPRPRVGLAVPSLSRTVQCPDFEIQKLDVIWLYDDGPIIER